MKLEILYIYQSLPVEQYKIHCAPECATGRIGLRSENK